MNAPLDPACGPHPVDPRPTLCRIADPKRRANVPNVRRLGCQRGIYGPFIPDHDHQKTTVPIPYVPPGPCQPSPRFSPARVFPKENKFSSEKTQRRSLPPSRPYPKEPSEDLRFVSLRGRYATTINKNSKICIVESCLVVRKVRAALPLMGVCPRIWGKGRVGLPESPPKGDLGPVGVPIHSQWV